MKRSKQMQIAAQLLTAEIASGRIKATEPEHYTEEILGRLLVLFGIVEDAVSTLGLKSKETRSKKKS